MLGSGFLSSLKKKKSPQALHDKELKKGKGVDSVSGKPPLIRHKSVFHWPILHNFKNHYSKSSKCWNHPDAKPLGSTASPSVSLGTSLNLLIQVLRRQDLLGHLKNLAVEGIEVGNRKFEIGWSSEA